MKIAVVHHVNGSGGYISMVAEMRYNLQGVIVVACLFVDGSLYQLAP